MKKKSKYARVCFASKQSNESILLSCSCMALVWGWDSYPSKRTCYISKKSKGEAETEASEEYMVYLQVKSSTIHQSNILPKKYFNINAAIRPRVCVVLALRHVAATCQMALERIACVYSGLQFCITPSVFLRYYVFHFDFRPLHSRV